MRHVNIRGETTQPYSLTKIDRIIWTSRYHSLKMYGPKLFNILPNRIELEERYKNLQSCIKRVIMLEGVFYSAEYYSWLAYIRLFYNKAVYF